MSTEHGGIAQLGERLNGIQEVSSSILLISTREIKGLQRCNPFFYARKLQPRYNCYFAGNNGFIQKNIQMN